MTGETSSDPENSSTAPDRETGSDVSRRAVVGAAWAVPVIALAATAPAAAASAGAVSVPLTVTFTYNPGGRRWIGARVTVRNPTAAALTVVVSSTSTLSPRGYTFERGWTYVSGATLMTTVAAGATSDWLEIYYGLDESVAPERPFTMSVFANASGLEQSSRVESGVL